MSKDLRCVLLAQRHHHLMEGVRSLLETSFEVVVMVADEISLAETAQRSEIPIVVLDLSLTPGEGLGLVRRLRDRFPALQMIVISADNEPCVSQSALDAGADGFVFRHAIATDLLVAVDTVLAGKRYVSPKRCVSP